MTNSAKWTADRTQMLKLCGEIDMPDEVTGKLADHAESYDFTEIMPHFDGLLSVQAGDASVKAIAAALKEDGPDGLLALTVYLAAAIRTGEEFARMGVSREIFADTMKAFTRFVNEHMESYGRYGFDRGFWTYRQLSMALVRLGTLEFEMRPLGKAAALVGCDANAEDLALSVHIPSDAVMTREALDDSYRQAVAFFARYFPAFDYKHVYCDTWLLAPALAELLPQGSRIVNFQSDYSIRRVDEENKSFVKWVYKEDYETYENLPETTSLARAIKARLLAGGKIGAAFGVIEGFRERFGTAEER